MKRPLPPGYHVIGLAPTQRELQRGRFVVAPVPPQKPTKPTSHAPTAPSFSDRWDTAQHEAAHFVEATVRGARPPWVRIHAAGGGEMRMDDRASDVTDIAVRYAGAAVETMRTGAIGKGSDDDIEVIDRMATRLWGANANAKLAPILNEVESNLRRNHTAIYELAKVLVEKREMTGAEARAIVERYIAA